MLNDRKLQRALLQHSSVARKVFDSVPKQEAWAFSQIHGDLRRRGLTYNSQHVDRCLYDLKASGIIQATGAGGYVRTPLNEAPAIKPPPKNEVTPMAAKKPVAPSKPAKELNPLELLADIGQRAAELARDVEDAGLLIQEFIEEKEASVSQLIQLKALLKNI